MIKVGDLVRILGSDFLGSWEGQVGIVTKVPRILGGRWAILLTSGQLIATLHASSLEVINVQED
tara:strand:- start:31 stop:222 length:192 start_codon:yes stop_codon:yes gene_type:complete